MTIDLNFGPLLEPLAASRQVIAVELRGHGHTADTGRPMTIEALADDVVAPLNQLGIAEADLFGFSLGGLVAYAVALGAPTRVRKLTVARPAAPWLERTGYRNGRPAMSGPPSRSLVRKYEPIAAYAVSR
jgi:pimeloyl-ACP methyl ester carboxylesterase